MINSLMDAETARGVPAFAARRVWFMRSKERMNLWHAPAVDETIPLNGPALTSLDLPGLGLRVAEGPDTGVAADLASRTLRIGTASDNDLVLTDPAVSRHHCEIRVEHEHAWLQDSESTNGTVLNGVRVKLARVEPGMRIQIGETTLQLVVGAERVQIPISTRSELAGLVGKSLAMRELYATLERAAPTDASVLLHGETGTGKELAAEAIHLASKRSDGPFVIVDCGAIPPTLFESELFGHKRGSFTGAVSDRIGLLQQASGGTVFLDEIGELAPELQPKLLRALERRHVRPVGGSGNVDIDVRVVAASHRNLVEEVNKGTFREDLYFRLAVVRVSLPPLRARREDIPMLIRLFVSRLAPDRMGDVPTLVAALEHRSFTGNVRELRNAVEEHLILGHSAPFLGGSPVADASSGLPDAVFSRDYKEASEMAARAFQKEYVTRLLRRTDGNVSEAARAAGMSRRYLQTIMSRLGIG